MRDIAGVLRDADADEFVEFGFFAFQAFPGDEQRFLAAFGVGAADQFAGFGPDLDDAGHQ